MLFRIDPSRLITPCTFEWPGEPHLHIHTDSHFCTVLELLSTSANQFLHVIMVRKEVDFSVEHTTQEIVCIFFIMIRALHPIFKTGTLQENSVAFRLVFLIVVWTKMTDGQVALSPLLKMVCYSSGATIFSKTALQSSEEVV